MATPAFSYAQAAKRSAPVQPSAQLSSTSAPNTSTPTGKDESQATNGAVSAPSVPSTEPELRNAASSTIQAEKSSMKQDFDTTSVQGSIQSSGSTEQNAKISRETNGSSARPRRNPEDMTSRSTSRTSRSNDGEARKGRKGKKGRGADKNGDNEQDQEQEEAPEIPKPVLVEASVPMVNIWTQRKEAQAAKAKQAPAPATVSTSAPITTVASQAQTSAASGDTQAKGKSTTESESQGCLTNGVNGDKDHRKPVDSVQAGEQQIRRHGPRGSRVIEKSEKVNGTPPPVADAALFPDLKTAVVNGDGPKKSQEKTDRVDKESQEESAPAKGRKSQWTPLPFVPSVSWDTPIPPRPNKPRGPGRGGREVGTSRGGSTAATGARPTPGASSGSEKGASSTVASNATKSAEARLREGSVSARTPALPPNSSKRNSVELPTSKDARRSGPPQSVEASEISGDKQAQPLKGKGESNRPARVDGSRMTTDIRQFPGAAGSSERPNHASGKAPDYSKDGTSHATGNQSFSRPRGGRGSGPYRNPHNPPSIHTANGQYPMHTSYSGRPNGYQSPPYGGGFQQFTPRVPRGRPGLGPNGQTSLGAGSYTTRMPQDPNGLHFGIGHPGVQPDFPYTFEAIQLVKTQVEYYFSIENLCKDTYLRQNIDSQGFAPLSLIAGFKRMRGIADVNLLRLVCAQSEHLDYICGDDDVERIRMRHRWNEFLMPIGERFKEAQNDGPQHWIWRSNHSLGLTYPLPIQHQAPPMYHSGQPMYQQYGPEDYMYGPGYMVEPFQGPVMNGVDTNGYHPSSGTQLSAAVPEFSPVSATPVVKLGDLTNFKDEDIEKLTIVTTPTKQLHDLANHSAEIPSTSNGTREATSLESSEIVIGDSDASSTTDAAMPNRTDDGQLSGGVFWSTSEPAGGAESHTSYLPFRDQALEERQNAAAGETPKKMQDLYNFWLHFLSKHFNEKMYLEFRQCALEDATQEAPSKFGLSHLLRYYDRLSNEQLSKPWAGEVSTTPHIINMHATEARDLALRPSTAVEN